MNQFLLDFKILSKWLLKVYQFTVCVCLLCETNKNKLQQLFCLFIIVKLKVVPITGPNFDIQKLEYSRP